MRRHQVPVLAAVFMTVLAVRAAAPLPPSVPAPPPAAASGIAAILHSMTGRWEGVLEYRDYQSDGRVTLPARLWAARSPLGPGLLQDLEFVDPGSPVRSRQLVTVDDRTGVVSIVMMDARDVERETYTVDETTIEDPGRAWTIVLRASSRDDGRAADVRVTQTLRDGVLTSRKDVRYPDEPGGVWQFRNETRFERVTVDPTTLAGTWRVDLRPAPGARPYFQELHVDAVADGVMRGRFYDTPIRDGRVNVQWGEVHFAFVTEDGSTVYRTAGVVRGDRIEGTTHAPQRGLLSVWHAERE